MARQAEAVVGTRAATRPWTIVGLLWVAYFINYIDRQVAFSIFPSLRSELGFTSSQLALVGTVFTWVYSLFMPLSGRLADVLRRERIIIVSLGLWSLCTLGTGLSSSVPSFLFWRAAMGITESLYVPAALGLLASVLPVDSRSKGLAAHTTAQLAGIATGGWFGGWAADTHGWRSGFWILAAVGVAYALVLAVVVPRLRLPEKTAAKRNASRPSDLARSWCFMALCVVFLLFCAMLWVQYAWLADHMYNRFGLSMTRAGFMAMVFLQGSTAIGVLAGGFGGDAISRRIPGGRLYLAAAGVIVAAPFAYATFAAETLFGSVLSACLFGLFAALMMSNVFAAAYDVVASENYGLAAGILNLAGGFAGGAGILVVGVWKDSLGTAAIAGLAGAAAVVAGLVFLMIVRRRFPREHAAI